MLPLDFGPGFVYHRRNLPFLDIKTPSEYFLQIPIIKFEEEEDSGDSYHEPDGSKGGLENWWAIFKLQHKYPLYCMVLATEADENVALLIEKHHKELAEIAGDKCCLVYFRTLEKAKLLEPFHSTEHTEVIIHLIKIIDVPPNRLPCVLFFEQITSGEFVYVGLGNKTATELVGFLRELFTFIYLQKEVSLSAVKAFKFSKHLETTRVFLSKNLIQFSEKMVVELIKSLAKL